MSLRLSIRLLLSGLLGFLLVVTVGAALQFNEIATMAQDLAEPDLAAASGSAIRAAASTAALGLGIVGALALLLGAWISRTVRRSLLERLSAIDVALTSIDRGDRTRRVSLGGSDELSRFGAVLDRALDERDRADAAAQGRSSELRAMLVALLHERSEPAAITGIDGEILVSTLSADQEEALRSLTPQVRRAARTLLSRGFVSAAELVTSVEVEGTHRVEIRALAVGERRVVGWLAVFARGAAAQPSLRASTDASPG